MKIALFGYGQMGKLIEEEALAAGHEVVAVLTSKNRSIEALKNADVALDFSRAEAVMQNLRCALECQVPLIIGTTGWLSQLDEAKELTAASCGSVLFAPNFSLGVLIFLELLKLSSRLMAHYDVAGIEIHHNKKQDAPSGTALLIESVFNANRSKPLTFSSLRVGSVAGEHSVLFDSPVDSISLTHSAKNRRGFAQGALLAAQWLQGKTGFYTTDDFIQGVVHGI